MQDFREARAPVGRVVKRVVEERQGPWLMPTWDKGTGKRSGKGAGKGRSMNEFLLSG